MGLKWIQYYKLCIYVFGIWGHRKYAICQQKEDVYPQLVSYQSFDTLFSGVDITHPFKVFHECLTTIMKIARQITK